LLNMKKISGWEKWLRERKGEDSTKSKVIKSIK
jgi:hypothetical protein